MESGIEVGTHIFCTFIQSRIEGSSGGLLSGIEVGWGPSFLGPKFFSNPNFFLNPIFVLTVIFLGT